MLREGVASNQAGLGELVASQLFGRCEMSEVNYLIQKPKRYETDMDGFQRNMGIKWRRRARRLIDRRWEVVNKRSQERRYAAH